MIFFFWTEIFPRNVFIIITFLSMTIASIALFVLNFLNLPQGDILTKAKKYCETLKDASLPLPM